MSGDAIYIAGVPLDATEQELVQHFGQNGGVKIDVQTGLPCVWIYKDSQTGQSKGDALVCYQDPYAAASAVQWFHQKPMRGRRPHHDANKWHPGSILHVSLTQAATGGVLSQLPYSQPSAIPPPSSHGLGSIQPVSGYGMASYGQMGYPPSGPAMQQPVNQGSNWSGGAYPAGRGSPRGGEASRGRGRKITAAPQGPARLFGPDDWPCPSCGNTNWARRPRCNLCGAPKPGTFDMKREGQAGGFKELDEKEAEEDRRRRKAMEEADDGELYDDYGRIKKRYRNMVNKETRERAALARLCGSYDPSPSAQELATLLGKEIKTDAAEGVEASIKEDSDRVESVKGEDEKQKVTEGRQRSKERDGRRSRSISPRRHSMRDARERSNSPRHRSRRYSPRRNADLDRRSQYHRPREYEDRRRSRR